MAPWWIPAWDQTVRVKGRMKRIPEALQNIDYMALKKRKAVDFQQLCSGIPERGSTSSGWDTVVFLFSAEVALLWAAVEGHCGEWNV